MLSHRDYVKNFMNYIYNNSQKSKAEIEEVPYGQNEELVLCPEPLTFLTKLDDCSGDSIACRKAFEHLSRDFKRISIRMAPENGIWFNSSRHGINLRPGISDSSQSPTAIQMGDVNVHGLMVGQTGSGKSVLLNNLIFNLLMEYAPWEVDLYLADFKRVEFSRYMNRYHTPHLRACAATGEVRYVLSLIEYLVDCMNARETFFSRIGITNIADFRSKKEYPNMVLPRILLIVDEFQQLFLEASNRESEKLHQLMTAIVKKGRATGVHILFASQEISHTLNSSDLANFRLRLALNSRREVSMRVLGNPEAFRLHRGEVLVNVGDGSMEANQKYLVPYIETEKLDNEGESYFYAYLNEMVKLAGQYGFEKSKKFYQEDYQEPLSNLASILNRIGDYRKNLYTGTHKYFEALTLGKYVTYSNLNYDIQNVFVEYGRNKNILAVSSKTEDIAYMQKLLVMNFLSSPRNQMRHMEYRHILYSFDQTIGRLFPLGQELGQDKVCTNPDDLQLLKDDFYRLRKLKRLFTKKLTPLEFVFESCREDMKREGLNDEERELAEKELFPYLGEVFGNIPFDEIPEVAERILSEKYEKRTCQIAENLILYEKFQQNPYMVFPPTIYWISGVDSVERLPEWFCEMLKDGMDYNILFILMAASDFEQLDYLGKFCDYLFVGGNNSRIYEHMLVDYSHKAVDSIVMDLHIRSTAEDRSFKKYKCSFGRVVAPTIPFDELLGAL